MRSVSQAPHFSDDEVTTAVLRQIGHHLRTAREERGASLADIAANLRIKRGYLTDLENGEVGNIPGRAYALGFLRTYADYLGYNGQEVVEQVKNASNALPETPRLEYRTPLPENRRPTLVIVGVSAVLMAGVYIGWTYYERQQTALTAALVAGEPQTTAEPTMTTEPAAKTLVTTETLQDPEPEAVEPATTEPQVTEAETVAAAAVEADVEAPAVTTSPVAAQAAEPTLPAIPEPPAPIDQQQAIERLAASEPDSPAEDNSAANAELAALIDGNDAGQAADDATEIPVTGADEPPEVDVLAALTDANGGEDVRAFGGEPTGSRIALLASEASWVQVQSSDRDYVWTRTLEPGDVFFVPDRDDLALWTGNAGGLQVLVNGQPLPPLGDRGEVRRDVPLAVDALRASLAQAN